MHHSSNKTPPSSAPKKLIYPTAPNASPRLYVTAASRIPTNVISKPDDHHGRAVMSDLEAPTRKWAAMLTAKAMITASNPPTKKKGMMGMNAPTAVETAADPEDTQGFGKWCSE